ncbi:MAG: hypothetical protein ACR2MD_01850 [Aridibacter sp.]
MKIKKKEVAIKINMQLNALKYDIENILYKSVSVADNIYCMEFHIAKIKKLIEMDGEYRKQKKENITEMGVK